MYDLLSFANLTILISKYRKKRNQVYIFRSKNPIDHSILGFATATERHVVIKVVNKLDVRSLRMPGLHYPNDLRLAYG